MSIVKNNSVKENKNQLEELSNRIKYLQADFENLRKYYEKEQESIIRLSNKDLIKDILEVLDDMDCAIKTSNENEVKGVIMIREKLMKLLSKHGLEQIKCVGEQFDPNKHEVVLKEDGDELITLELQKGYSLNGTVIRPSKVKVGGGVS